MRSNKFDSLKRKAYIPVILALTCFILVVVGGYYLVKIKSSNSSLTKSIIPENNKTDNLKLYSNKQLGVELKYPSEYSILKEDNESVKIGLTDKPLITISLGHSGDYKSFSYCDETRTSYEQPYKYPCLGQGVIIGANNDFLEKSLKNSESELFIVSKNATTTDDILQVYKPQKMEIVFSEEKISLEKVSTIISTLKFTNVFSQAVILQLQKLIYEHDDKIFEPIEYSLINNTLKPIYFLRGCAVSLPKIYKVENNKRTELQEIHVCTAEPEIVQLSSGSKIYLMWDQKIRGKFVKDGKYQFGLEYKLEKNGEKHEVFSDIFSIKKVRWDLNKQKQICDLFKSGVRSNSSVYSKQDCLNKL